jgi:16S rRNA processing protein RimM
MKSDEKIHIATIGKCVGLRGDLKLHLHTDFPQQFTTGKSFVTDKNTQLTIHTYNPETSLIQFVGYGDRTAASKLTNQKLFTTKSRSKEECGLKEGEYFWFDLVGAVVKEGDLVLGKVDEIDRIVNTDYLIVRTDAKLVEKGLSKKFYIPYIPKYIDHFDEVSKTVLTEGAYDILEAS